jgi:hypothetical protein
VSSNRSPRARRIQAAKDRKQVARWQALASPVAARPLVAQQAQACWFCVVPIRLGDSIALYVVSAQDKWWGHADCVAAARRSAAEAAV